jgi:hypothetical protein
LRLLSAYWLFSTVTLSHPMGSDAPSSTWGEW